MLEALLGAPVGRAARGFLDACGAHFGYTPDSPTAMVYHHHVQELPPFSFGCYGPSASGGLVTLAECRSLYSGCGDGDETNTRGGAEAGGSHLDAGTARLMLLLFCKVVR